ncbi:laminin subunit beta-4 isoform X2 [Hippopotamus amphibius kiboko]|uniref:laminin subunit beta-4 isoform X2 n=1 Tax=Hippopotamus amphibius kiboko TaxID=575201 RepID=UPI0025959E56|nr:laminin subunit beta-4 isoform X2 [Hippopotamus amphibius kiboko]
MQFQLTFFLHLGLLSYTEAQDECSRGACRPPTGNLLVGRSEQLTASSTCGLGGAQKYCILSYLEGEQKCFICDSRFPYDAHTQPNSHAIENVITSFEPDREKKWWQSENGLDHVSIRLDLEALFQFSHLILTFKTFRPAAMFVERSTDYGHTWKVFKYFAKDCATSFPNITSGQAQGVGDLVCDSKYSDIEPSTGGEVVLKVLDPSFEIENPYSPYIQDLVTLTNLRINFTKLHTLGDTLLGRRQIDSLDKYYYALYEMIVRGSCFCNGHASECGPTQKVRGDVFSPPGMVHGQCVCQHNTDGLNCERCKDFFQDAPWRPAAGLLDSACRACHCNGHSDHCHFDMTAYLASGGRSGGVCDGCRHNTEGQHCDRCRPLFYRDPLKAISDPYACIPCECDPDGTISGGLCVSHSDPDLGSVAGQCLCKDNVEGAKCDRCKPNHYGLSATDPLGCQPCDCNRLGSLPLLTCDADTGQCLCQSFATGPHCEECTVGYWGLENHHGCSSCDCDIGGAYSNMCSPKDGQCDCRPHVTGRSCTEPEPGYFFAPLNFYLCEAEEATPLQGLAPLILATALPTCDVYFQQQGDDFVIDKGNIIMKRNQKQSIRADELNEGSVASGQLPAVSFVLREPVPGMPVTWTGPGFARVLPGAGLRFAVGNIPAPMDFAIAIRYETQSTDDWTVQMVVNPAGGSEHCTRETPQPKPQPFALPAASRIMLLPTPICLEPDVQYSIDVYFSQPLEGGFQAHSHILVDSLVLIPQINSLENFCSKQDLDEYQLHNCLEIASAAGPQVLPGACERLIASLSARLHNGAMACKCHPQGSVGPNCSRLEGQCQCKAGVTGRCCDACIAGSYGLGHHGCHSCHCHPQGSKSTVCDQVTGQCPCHGEVAGRRCDQCLAGYFGFPNCHPCLCNGFAELCDPETGSCFNCGGFTTGRNCERCIDGYYGNPSSGQSCRPCPCPDVPSSNQYFAHSCYQNPWSSDIICNCLQGYAGVQCGECSAGFYGNPRISGAPCQPCACSNNIDVTDPESCSPVTGECLKCLHNTQGPSCQLCKPGHFGSALNQTCKRCSCHPSGVSPSECPPGGGACLCDPDTGTCPCLPNVAGRACDRCADGYWNLVPGRGCQPCDCDPRTSRNRHCDQLTGQCPCRSGYDGKRCSECEENYYGDPPEQCIPCDCNREGSQEPICDQDTGMCRCREGVSGPRCDHCARGHGQEFPACLRCHLCFDQWDHTISSLSKVAQGLIRLAASMEDKRETLPVCEADFKGLGENMSEIERIWRHPVFSSGEFLKVKDYHDSARKQIMALSEQLKTAYEFQDLKETIERKRNKANLLLEDLQEEIALHTSARNASIMDSSKNIKKYYQSSLSAEKNINEATSIVNNSEKSRNDLLNILDTLTSKENLSLEKLKQVKIPDAQILHEKECGEGRDMACVLSSCSGPSCRGSLTLSRNTLQKAQEAESMIDNLNNQVQGLKNQSKNISKLAEGSKNNALQLSEKLRNMKNQSESEEEKMNLLIKKLKMFLLEENVPPEDIEKVANHVFDIHLSITSQNLTHELDKIRKLMQLCEDYRTEDNRLSKAANRARKVLVKAKAAEKAANVLLNLNKMLNKLQQVQITQGWADSTITQLTAEITKIKKEALQEFVELQNQYAILQYKRSTAGLTEETLGKVKQLKGAAAKLAGDTEDKIRRITADVHDCSGQSSCPEPPLKHQETSNDELSSFTSGCIYCLPKL